MTSHPLINRLAVAVLVISAATLGATIQRDMSPARCRCASEPHHVAHHASGSHHANHPHTN